jgi:hypothetical protein
VPQFASFCRGISAASVTTRIDVPANPCPILWTLRILCGTLARMSQRIQSDMDFSAAPTRCHWVFYHNRASEIGATYTACERFGLGQCVPIEGGLC